MEGHKLKRSRGGIPDLEVFTLRKAPEQAPWSSLFPGGATSQRFGPVACDEEVCWQILNTGCKLLVSQRAIKRERQKICSSVINASEKSEQRVTSPQLITTRGKGRSNHYPDPVIHIWLAPIVLLPRLPRKSVFPMLRGMFLALFMPSTCETRPPHISYGY